MATAEAKTIITPEDLLALPDASSYELVDGELVERKVSFLSSWVGTRLVIRLGTYCEAHNVGEVLQADSGYQCFPEDSSKVRKPDASFICRSRWRDDLFRQGHCRIAPDLAVEVLSPNELAVEVDKKVDEYLNAGCRLVWIINPENRSVRIYRAGGTIGFLRESAELDGEEVVPGFRCPLRELFPTGQPVGNGQE